MSRASVAFAVLLVGAVPGLATAQTPDGGVDVAPLDAGGDAGLVDAAGSTDAAAADDAAAPDLAVDLAPPSPPPPARTVTVSGRALAKGTKEPLGGASVIVDAVAVADADETGRFTVDIAPGKHRLQIQHPGMETLDVTIDDTMAGAERVFRLMPQQTGIRYETVVTPRPEQAPRHALRQEELTQTPGSFGDPFRVIESLPGVSQVVWPLSIYAIRGANPGNTGFLIDGGRVPALFHFALGPSVIHPYFLEGIDFYPGGYPVRYGRFVSGVVSARTRTPPTDRVHASADVRLIDAGAIVVAPWHDARGSVAVAGRYSYAGAVMSQFTEGAADYWDYQLRADHRLGSGRVTLFSFGSGDDLDLPESNRSGQGLTNKADLEFHRVELRWDGSVLGGRLTAAAQAGRDASATTIEQLVSLPVSVKTLSTAARLSYEHPVTSWADVGVGGDGELQRFRPSSSHPDAETQDVFRDRDVLSAGAFALLTVRAGSRLVLSPGYRHEVYRERGLVKQEPSPRLEVRVRPVREVWLKGTVGRFSQMASLPVAVPGFESFGLRQYGLQTSRQGSVGVEAPLWGAVSLDATAFYQRLRVTDLRSMFNTDLNKSILETRDGQAYGVELMLRRPMSERFSGWVSYTLSWSERVVNGVISASDWDQRHIINVVGRYRLPRGYAAGARFHYNTGRPYPVIDTLTLLPPVYQRLPSFHQVDLRLDKRFVRDRYVVDVYFELINSTFTRQVFDLKSNGGVTTQKGLKIALPSVGVHVDW